MATILVVDDEPDIVTIVRHRLEIEGYTVLTAPDGQTGLMLAFTRQPDLVILDVMMPNVDGFEVLRRMKNDGRNAGTPVIMLTAKADYASRAQAWEEYAGEYLTKPFSPDELARTVKSMLERQGDVERERLRAMNARGEAAPRGDGPE